METDNKDILDIGFPKLPKDVNLPKDIDRDDMRVQERERFKQDTEQRKTLVIWMIIVVSSWLLFTCAVVVAEICICKKLSDTVLCMLLGTTTANVLGLAMIVLQGLFTQHKK